AHLSLGWRLVGRVPIAERQDHAARGSVEQLLAVGIGRTVELALDQAPNFIQQSVVAGRRGGCSWRPLCAQSGRTAQRGCQAAVAVARQKAAEQRQARDGGE